MSNNVKGLLVVIVMAGIAYGIYKIVYAQAATSKDQQIAFLIANNYSTGTPIQLGAFGNDYIGAWYQAAVAKQPYFYLASSNTTYNTQGGMAQSAGNTVATGGVVQGS